jgi:hypothetical protein
MKFTASACQRAFTPRLLRPLLSAISLVVLASSSAHAVLVVTYAENSNSYNSSLTNTKVLTFDNLPARSKVTNYTWTNNSATVGTIDQFYVQASDQYGGAGSSGSNYPVQSQSVGGSNATPTTTITFSTSQGYYGLWWSAGDPANVLTFYSGNALVAQFTTSSLLTRLASSPDYYGNPRTNQNPAEAYAFINFFGVTGTTWDRIVMSNQGSSGFESDNWTTRVGSYGTEPGENPSNLPGVKVAQVSGTTVTLIPSPTPVPEPTSALYLLPALGLVALRRRTGVPSGQ